MTGNQPKTVQPAGGGEVGIEVRPFEGTVAEWDNALLRLPDLTFCHLGGWREIMDGILGHEPLYRVALNPDGEVVGLHPQVRVRSRLFGHYLLSMPFLSYGGPVGSDGARLALALDAEETARQLGVDLLELRVRKSLPGHLEETARKLTVLLDLPEDSEELWSKGLKSKVRSQVRRPMKEGMEARFGPDCLDSFYRVFSRTMRDLGTPVLSRSFFEALAATFPDEVVFCTIELKGEPAAAGCGFLWGGEFEITWAGAVRAYSRMAPNMLLYWSLMEHAISKGTRVFNFGRCSPGSGTHKFKNQWGGIDTPLPWAQFTPKDRTATPSPNDAGFELAVAVWKRLPLALANRLGPVISRNLP